MNPINVGLHFSEQGFTLLHGCEGFESKIYPDGNGFDTIGYGHKVLPGEDFAEGITEAEAEQICCKDVEIAEAIVKRLVNVPLKQGQFDCLVDFVFNEGGKAFGESTMLTLLNSGMYGSVPRQLYRTDPDDGSEHGWIFINGGQTIEPGLVTRRKAEIALWNS